MVFCFGNHFLFKSILAGCAFSPSISFLLHLSTCDVTRFRACRLFNRLDSAVAELPEFESEDESGPHEEISPLEPPEELFNAGKFEFVAGLFNGVSRGDPPFGELAAAAAA